MEQMEKVDEESAVVMQKVAGNMHILTTAITDGFAMLGNGLVPNPNHGNMGHQFQTVAMQSNRGKMQNDGMM